jgi:hypothetical protein
MHELVCSQNTELHMLQLLSHVLTPTPPGPSLISQETAPRIAYSVLSLFISLSLSLSNGQPLPPLRGGRHNMLMNIRIAHLAA